MSDRFRDNVRSRSPWLCGAHRLNCNLVVPADFGPTSRPGRPPVRSLANRAKRPAVDTQEKRIGESANVHSKQTFARQIDTCDNRHNCRSLRASFCSPKRLRAGQQFTWWPRRGDGHGSRSIKGWRHRNSVRAVQSANSLTTVTFRHVVTVRVDQIKRRHTRIARERRCSLDWTSVRRNG